MPSGADGDRGAHDRRTVRFPRRAQPPPGQVSFSTPSLFPKFGPNVHDYVVRCNDGPVTVKGHASGAGRRRSATTRSAAATSAKRCRWAPGGPSRSPCEGREPAALSLPRALPAERLPRIHLYPLRTGIAEVLLGGPRLHLYGQALRDHLRQPRSADLVGSRSRLGPQGASEREDPLVRCQLLSEQMGDPPPRRERRPHLPALVAGPTPTTCSYWATGAACSAPTSQQRHVDTSAYGGSQDANVTNTELQQVGPGGQLVWDWKSQHHISLAETGHHWHGSQTTATTSSTGTRSSRPATR